MPKDALQERESGLSPEDEEHLFDAFDTSFEDDFEGVPVFIPFQRKKPYECGKCGRIFRHKTGHIHTGKKPFLRGQCGKAFRHSSDITKHRRVHAGEKPCSCGPCGKAFNCGSNLRKHQKPHVGERSPTSAVSGGGLCLQLVPDPAPGAPPTEEALSEERSQESSVDACRCLCQGEVSLECFRPQLTPPSPSI
ncbi:zinc finger protein 41 homolog [Dugong dugon]